MMYLLKFWCLFNGRSYLNAYPMNLRRWGAAPKSYQLWQRTRGKKIRNFCIPRSYEHEVFSWIVYVSLIPSLNVGQMSALGLKLKFYFGCVLLFLFPDIMARRHHCSCLDFLGILSSALQGRLHVRGRLNQVMLGQNLNLGEICHSCHIALDDGGTCLKLILLFKFFRLVSFRSWESG